MGLATGNIKCISSVFVGLAGLSIDKRNRCINTGLHIPIPILAFEIRLRRSILFHDKKKHSKELRSV